METEEELLKEIEKYESLIVDCDIFLSHIKPGTRGAHDGRDRIEYYRDKRADAVKRLERLRNKRIDEEYARERML